MSSPVSHKQFLEIARIYAESSKCVSMKVGALIVKDNRIVSTGFNGSPPGCPNCSDIHKHRGPEHTAWSQDNEIHAEMNAIIYAAKNTVSVNGSVMYSTHEPCKNCLKHILGTGHDGIQGIVFSEMYYNESVADKNTKLDLIAGRRGSYMFVYEEERNLLLPYIDVVRSLP